MQHKRELGFNRKEMELRDVAHDRARMLMDTLVELLQEETTQEKSRSCSHIHPNLRNLSRSLQPDHPTQVHLDTFLRKQQHNCKKC